MRWWYLRRQVAFSTPVVLVYMFLLGPLFVVLLASFEGGQTYSFRFPPNNPSIEWYLNIPTRYFLSMSLSFAIAILAATISTLLGASAALAIIRGRLIGKTGLQAYFRVPLQIPFVVTAIAFLQGYNLIAIVTGFDALGTLAGFVAAHVFLTLPYAVSSVAVVLARLPPNLEESAQVLGASNWSCFRRVTLPLMKPGLFAGFFYGLIVSFSEVPVAMFVGGSSLVTLPVEIFQTLQFDFDPAVLALSSIVIVVSACLILAIQRLVGLDLVLPSNRR